VGVLVDVDVLVGVWVVVGVLVCVHVFVGVIVGVGVAVISGGIDRQSIVTVSSTTISDPISNKEDLIIKYLAF
jgi:hypothetical protein